MSQGTHNIFLGDFARALSELGVKDARGVRLVAELLGLEAPGAAAEGVAPEAGTPGRGGASAATVAAPGKVKVGEDPPEEPPEPPAPRPAVRAVSVDLSSTKGETEEWIAEVVPFPSQEELPAPGPPPLSPLLAPQWARGILSAALATRAEDGPLDTERVVERLANYENVERFPTVVTRTLRRGAHLLLDKSQAMTPFTRDQAWLAREIRRVAGGSHVALLRFVGSPLRGAGGAPPPWPAYEPPPAGTPVVLLTDLGAGRPPLAADRADAGEWGEFAAEMHRAGCPVVAFVPYGPARWPPGLERHMTIVEWDRRTTVATVGRMLQLARGALGS
jgi:hypothetical protein